MKSFSCVKDDISAMFEFMIQHNWSTLVRHLRNRNLSFQRTTIYRSIVTKEVVYLRYNNLYDNIILSKMSVGQYILSLLTLQTKQSTCQSKPKALTALSVIGLLQPAHFEHVNSM